MRIRQRMVAALITTLAAFAALAGDPLDPRVPQVPQLATDFAVQAYIVVTKEITQTAGKAMLRLDDLTLIEPGLPYKNGFYWNASDEEAVVWAGDVAIVIPGGEAVFVDRSGMASSFTSAAPETYARQNNNGVTFSATCTFGYYACCNTTGAKCVRVSNTTATCQAGGEGATSCSITP